MNRLFRRSRAHFRYLRRPLLGFLPLVLGTCMLVLIGGVCFQRLYHHEQLTFAKALYITWCLIFMEHVYEYPDHIVLQLFYWVLPPLGLALILDGIVRFSYHVLRRDETGKEWVQAMAATYSDHVVLCGLGKVGVRVLQQLLKLRQDVVVLEKDKECPNIAFARQREVPVLIGSGREDGIINTLNIATAKSIVLATDDDLANLEIALDARKANPEIRVVLRMFDQELASKVRDSFDISLAFSTSSLAAPLFATSSTDKSIVNAFYVRDRLYVIANIEVAANSDLAGQQVHQLSVQHHIFIVAHERDENVTFCPEGERVLEAGDQITLQTEPATLKEVHQWNRSRESAVS